MFFFDSNKKIKSFATIYLTLCLQLASHQCKPVYSAQTVFSGKPEILISPGLVKKEGLTLDACAKACLQEKTIKCQFFKFVNDTKTCFLSETDHPKIQKLIQHIKPNVKMSQRVQSNVKMSADLFDPEFRDTHRSHHRETSYLDGKDKDKKDKDDSEEDRIIQKLRGMMSRVLNLEKQLKKVKTLEIFVNKLKDKVNDKSTGLKDLIKIDDLEKRMLKNLKKKLASLKEQSREINDDLRQLQKSQKTVTTHIKKLRDSNSQLGDRVGKLKNSTLNLGNTVKQIRQSDMRMKDRVKKIELLSAKMRAKLEEFANVGSGMKISEDKLGTNHKKILQAVRNIKVKSKSLGEHLRKLSYKMANISRQLQNNRSARKEIKEDIARIMKNIKSLQSNMVKISDPKGPETRKWQREVSKLKNLISSLSETNKKIKADLSGRKSDIASLLKDLTRVQLAGQSMKAKLAGLRQTTEQLRATMKAVQKEKALAPDSVKIAKIESKLMRVVTFIYTREKIAQDKMSAFNKSLRKIKEQVEALRNGKDGAVEVRKLWRAVQNQSKDVKHLQRQVTAKLNKLKPVSMSKVHELQKLAKELTEKFNKIKKETEKISSKLISKTRIGIKIQKTLRQYASKLNQKWRKSMAVHRINLDRQRKKIRQLMSTARALTKKVNFVYNKMESYRRPKLISYTPRTRIQKSRPGSNRVGYRRRSF